MFVGKMIAIIFAHVFCMEARHIMKLDYRRDYARVVCAGKTGQHIESSSTRKKLMFFIIQIGVYVAVCTRD